MIRNAYVSVSSSILFAILGYVCTVSITVLTLCRSVDETLRLVQAFQYTDKHGEVCPAGWKPGQDTIIPNPTDKLNYFTKHAEEL